MRVQRSTVLVLVVALAGLLTTACEVRVAGKRCAVGSPLAQDATHVLQCQNGRWARVATKLEVAERLLAAFHSIPIVVAAGDGHACASMLDRSVRCWGRNTSGQLGDGTTTSRSLPVDVGALRLQGVYSSGPGHSSTLSPGRLLLGDASSCGVSPGQTGPNVTTWMKCWGAVSEPASVVTEPQEVKTGGQGITNIAFGPRSFCFTVQFVVGAVCQTELLRMPAEPNATAVGRAHECLVEADSRLVCLGTNDRGQLGDGTTTSIPFTAPSGTALADTGLTSPREVGAGGDTTCAVTTSAALTCWGANGRGQVGDGTTTDRSKPTAVNGLGPVVELAVGRDHACAIVIGSTLRCWGANTNGQLGDGSTTDRLAPTAVTGLTNVTRVATGAGSTCAIADRGVDRQKLFCWGRNDWGQVGDGTTTERHEPTLVRF